MFAATKVNALIVTSVALLCVYAVTDIDAKPLDIYDEIVGSNDKLLQRMVDLIDSIGADDSDENSSGRGPTTADDSSRNSNELKDMKPSERCMLPVRKGVCRALIPRWSYNPATQDCREFKFGGCDGNGNNFASRKQCMEMCGGL